METNTDPAITRYVNEVLGLPNLSREQELELWLRWRDHRDQQARDEVLRTSLRAVVIIALKYRGYGFPLGELIAEGNLGILHAWEKFEPERGLRFVTYAAYWIRAYILNAVIQSWSLVSVGSASMRSVFYKLRRENVRIVCLIGDGEQAPDARIAKFEAPREKVPEMSERLVSKDESFDTGRLGDGRVSLAETHAAVAAQSCANRQGTQQVSRLVDSASGALDARERVVVEHHLMKDEDQASSLAEFGRRIGSRRQQVRQLEERAQEKLRQRMADSVVKSRINASSLGSAA